MVAEVRTKEVRGHVCWGYSKGIPIGLKLEVKLGDCPHAAEDGDNEPDEPLDYVACVTMGEGTVVRGVCPYLHSLLFTKGGFIARCNETLRRK